MANKTVALLLVVCLVIATSVEAKTWREAQGECKDYCHSICHFGESFCYWYCGVRCVNPGSAALLNEEISSGKMSPDVMREYEAETKNTGNKLE
ncbi:hypothetical protein RJT34_25164 [Clitoria ternatea]|uniref:Cyclotide n=1 Tax=Clitoria ternatea TaxID=43366 RepID=A0AAN9II87_CLITE